MGPLFCDGRRERPTRSGSVAATAVVVALLTEWGLIERDIAHEAAPHIVFSL